MCILLQFFSVSACLFLKEKLLHTIQSMSQGKPSIVKVPELKDFYLICEGSTEALLTLPLAFPQLNKTRSMGFCERHLVFSYWLPLPTQPLCIGDPLYSVWARNLNSLKVGMEFATPSAEVMLKLPLSKVVLLYWWHLLTFSPQQTCKTQIFGPGALLQKTYYESSLSKFHKFRL